MMMVLLVLIVENSVSLENEVACGAVDRIVNNFLRWNTVKHYENCPNNSNTICVGLQ